MRGRKTQVFTQVEQRLESIEKPRLCLFYVYVSPVLIV